MLQVKNNCHGAHRRSQSNMFERHHYRHHHYQGFKPICALSNFNCLFRDYSRVERRTASPNYSKQNKKTWPTSKTDDMHGDIFVKNFLIRFRSRSWTPLATVVDCEILIRSFRLVCLFVWRRWVRVWVSKKIIKSEINESRFGVRILIICSSRQVCLW